MLLFSFLLIANSLTVPRRGASKRVIFDEQQFQQFTTLDELKSVRVFGNVSVSASHPVIRAILNRWKENSAPGSRSKLDHSKIALCIEGGGMRGCVAAGAAAAINFLGLNDAFDVIYGSSAGAMVAAYFISRQYGAIDIYHSA
jgi:hypothetical protein